uniref:CHASE4 domain-containing protein n=1 Tax=Phenylobacterium glaciei TaxID=2803784 RepID=A0A974P2Y0_9CAUL|nr:hypothetical protein JKL49_23140 [Phenylobacterium glaciei]
MVGTLMLMGSLLLGARQVDDLVRHHEEFLVRRGVDGQVKAIENALQAQTVRDEAVLNLDNRFDPVWARNNLPLYLKPTIGAWDYLVVDGLDRPSGPMATRPRSRPPTGFGSATRRSRSSRRFAIGSVCENPRL